MDGRDELQDALLITTIRYDPQLEKCKSNPAVAGQPTRFYMITYHHQRLVDSAEYLGFNVEALGNVQDFHRTLENALDNAPDGAGRFGDRSLRVRVTLSREGEIATSFQPLSDVSLSTLYPESLDLNKADSTKQPWAVIISPHRTTPSAVTTFKSDKRDVYNKAREGMQDLYDNAAFPSFEALLVDDKDRILDGSISTVYFNRDGCWVTPPTGIGEGRWGTLRSASRRWALDRGMAIERHLDAKDVKEGERVWLGNGVRGFFPGVIVRNLIHEANQS